MSEDEKIRKQMQEIIRKKASGIIEDEEYEVDVDGEKKKVHYAEDK